ncbi:hypothetical protein [Streptomyces silvisoli]|uniref:Uncharacterized protein n=1 Tax=Streptomyces silvisoli TaxID=3034235 RepID=A0ABT5ZJV7_9ACTN|nr:hypothetical protein [Streptomyces silvisoli]MDF3290116.1 hypothetical protein [Streptomyces silvisoli]
MIDLAGIPEFTGDLEQLERDAGTLKKAASDIRGTGGDVHSKFQGLSSCYSAPEAEQLFATTVPVRDGAAHFATKLETVSRALSDFASTARPLVHELDQLRTRAAAFCKSVEGDHNWRKDQSKIDQNAHLVHEVGRVWGAFQDAERTTADKITSLYSGGTHFVVDDGSHKPGMYGFNANEAAKADKTPWGTVDEREYTGWAAAWHWTTDHVGSLVSGFFVDGGWEMLKGIGHMAGFWDWDTFKKTWSGIGAVFGGVSAYVMTPYNWALDKAFGPTDHSDTDRQKKALRDFGKSLVAWDEWGKNPTRAVGTVAFNVLTVGSGTLLKLGRVGALAKAGEAGGVGTAAKVAGALGKAGELVDPMTYINKAASATKIKVGDLMAGMKNLHSGTYTDFLNGTSEHIPRQAPVTLPNSSLRLPDGTILHHDGTMLKPDGTPHQDPIPIEAPADDRIAHQQIATDPHTAVHADKPVLAHAGGGVSHADNATTARPGAAHAADGRTMENSATPTGRRAAETSLPTDGSAAHTGGHSTELPSQSHGSGHGSGGHGDAHHAPQGHNAPSHENHAAHEDGHTDPAETGSHDPASGHDGAHGHERPALEAPPSRSELPPGKARLSLKDLRNLRDKRTRWSQAEDHVREMYGGDPETHYPVATNKDPEYPVTARGGRKVDVPVHLPDGRTLAVEVKMYQQYRMVEVAPGEFTPTRVEVPLTDHIREQIHKDIALRRQDPGYDPRWTFLHAGPSPALREYLTKAGIVFVEHH